MPAIPIAPQSFHLDLMDQTFRVDGVTNPSTYGTVGLFSDAENDYTTAVATFEGTEAVFTDDYFFYMKFVPGYDLGQTSDGTINMSFQVGDERSNWETVYFTHYDDIEPKQQWDYTGGDLKGMNRTNDQFFGIETVAAVTRTSTFSGTLTGSPYEMTIWRKITAEDTQLDGVEIMDGTVHAMQPGQVLACVY